MLDNNGKVVPSSEIIVDDPSEAFASFSQPAKIKIEDIDLSLNPELVVIPPEGWIWNRLSE